MSVKIGKKHILKGMPRLSALPIFVVSFPLVMTCFSCRHRGHDDSPRLNLQITVKDKNYFNVDEVAQEERVAENLPFRSYIPTICYTLTDLASGKVIYDSGVFEIIGNGSRVPVEIDDDDLPIGTYVLTVWGGLDDERPLDTDYRNIDFHQQNAEGNDIYLTTDTIVYDSENRFYLVEMERMKGKLIIKVENLPEGYETSQKRVTNLCDQADYEFNYTGSTMVKTEVTWRGSDVLTKTLLTPTVEDNVSVVRIQFLNEDENAPIISPDDVKVQISRNELTVLRYRWDEDAQNFDIFIQVNDLWHKYHELEIE